MALASLTPAAGICQYSTESPRQRAARIAETTHKAYAGDPEAQIEVGDWYCSGWDGKVNLKFATWWYLKAAKQGNLEAERKVGVAYEFGYGVRQDHGKALEWIRKATAADPSSAMWIANSYESGERISARTGCDVTERVPVDPAEAIQWYRIAADAGSENAQIALGHVYEREPAVRNFEEALRWYRKAAQTNPWAMGELARLYATGTGVPQDYSEAAKWYSKAVEQGPNGIFRYELGLLYEKGVGVRQDRQKAMELYFWPALYNSDARRRLVSLYEADLDLPGETDKVIGWYESAAEAGDWRAQVGLGLHYRCGVGVQQDFDVSQALFVLARRSAAGHDDLPSFVPKTGSATALALAAEMAKPGNLLKAVKEFLARPRPEVIEE